MILAIVFLGVTLAGIRVGLAQPVDAAKAAMVKSAYVLNFAKFTTWPDEAFADEDSPLVICVWGSNSIEKSLKQVVDGKTVGTRSIVVRHIEGDAADTTASARDNIRHNAESVGGNLNGCHLLYIGEDEINHVNELLKTVEPLSILTVSDTPGFAEQGGMLGLVLRKGKITFDANPAVIKKAGVRVSSKILKLAKIVQTSREK